MQLIQHTYPYILGLDYVTKKPPGPFFLVMMLNICNGMKTCTYKVNFANLNNHPELELDA